MKITHTTNKSEKTVEVTVSVTPLERQKIVIQENFIREYLSDKVKVSDCIKNNCVTNRDKPYCGSWIFKLDTPSKSVVKLNREKSTSIIKKKTKPETREKDRKTTKTEP